MKVTKRIPRRDFRILPNMVNDRMLASSKFSRATPPTATVIDDESESLVDVNQESVDLPSSIKKVVEFDKVKEIRRAGGDGSLLYENIPPSHDGEVFTPLPVNREFSMLLACTRSYAERVLRSVLKMPVRDPLPKGKDTGKKIPTTPSTLGDAFIEWFGGVNRTSIIEACKIVFDRVFRDATGEFYPSGSGRSPNDVLLLGDMVSFALIKIHTFDIRNVLLVMQDMHIGGVLRSHSLRYTPPQKVESVIYGGLLYPTTEATATIVNTEGIHSFTIRIAERRDESSRKLLPCPPGPLDYDRLNPGTVMGVIPFYPTDDRLFEFNHMLSTCSKVTLTLGSTKFTDGINGVIVSTGHDVLRFIVFRGIDEKRQGEGIELFPSTRLYAKAISYAIRRLHLEMTIGLLDGYPRNVPAASVSNIKRGYWELSTIKTPTAVVNYGITQLYIHMFIKLLRPPAILVVADPNLDFLINFFVERADL